jgi:hypothetical protein
MIYRVRTPVVYIYDLQGAYTGGLQVVYWVSSQWFIDVISSLYCNCNHAN